MPRNFKVPTHKFGRTGKPTGLKHNGGYRCQNCGQFYKCYKKDMPAQCLCGCMGFDFFHSESEGKRYGALLVKVKLKQISNLRKQVRIPLHTVNQAGLKVKVCDYIADFTYDRQSGDRVIEDHKGLKTPTFELKEKWLKSEYGETILLTK